MMSSLLLHLLQAELMRCGFARRKTPPSTRQQRQPSTAALLVLLQLFGLCLPVQCYTVSAQHSEQGQEQQDWTKLFPEPWYSLESELPHEAGAPASAAPTVRRSLAAVTAGPQVGQSQCGTTVGACHHGLLISPSQPPYFPRLKWHASISVGPCLLPNRALTENCKWMIEGDAMTFNVSRAKALRLWMLSACPSSLHSSGCHARQDRQGQVQG